MEEWFISLVLSWKVLDHMAQPVWARRYRRYDVFASSADIVASNDLRAIADVSASSANIVASNDDCFIMFHNVLSVSWCFTSGSQCFTCVSWCFTMFNNVLCLASHVTIGVAASAPADRLSYRDNQAEIADNSAEIGDGAAGIFDIAANVIPC